MNESFNDSCMGRWVVVGLIVDDFWCFFFLFFLIFKNFANVIHHKIMFNGLMYLYVNLVCEMCICIMVLYLFGISMCPDHEATILIITITSIAIIIIITTITTSEADRLNEWMNE